ncbi:hypothetical protein HKCCE2091_11495 [Rhodobacterales bacterium HKCCE2091]|nr:hypothetical protein [Rhodobacterales bacterium HKCCE2091]
MRLSPLAVATACLVSATAAAAQTAVPVNCNRPVDDLGAQICADPDLAALNRMLLDALGELPARSPEASPAPIGPCDGPICVAGALGSLIQDASDAAGLTAPDFSQHVVALMARGDTFAQPAAPAETAAGTPPPAPEPAPAAAPQTAQGSATGLTCEPRVQGFAMAFSCTGPDGAPMRLRPNQEGIVQSEIALRTLGCDVPVIDGDFANDEAALACFRDAFGLPDGPLSREAEIALALAGRQPDLERAERILALRGYERPGAAVAEPAAAPAPEDFTALIDHPDAALFVHPDNQRSWFVAEVDLLAWVSGGRTSRRTIHVRWPDLPDFAGRTFSLVDDGDPRFLLELGTDSAVLTAADGTRVEHPYETRTGFTCVPGPGIFAGECIGLVIEDPGSNRDGWVLRGAIASVQDGWIRPHAFSEAIEGREAWDAALGALAAAESEAAAAAAEGRVLDALPTEGLPGSAGAIIARLYRSPERVWTETAAPNRIPILAYHRAYAEVCRGNYDGPMQTFEVIAYGLQDYSYIPFQAYEVWGTYVADSFPIQADAYQHFGTAMAELPEAAWADWTGTPGGPDIALVDYFANIDRLFFEFTGTFVLLLPRIGCTSPTADRLEAALAEAYTALPRL